MKRFALMSFISLMAVLAPATSWGQATTAPAVADAAAAPTQPAARDGRPPFRSAAGERRFDGFGGGGGGRPRPEWSRGDGRPHAGNVPLEDVTEDEWSDVKAFMKAHSPERLKRLEEDIVDEKRQQMVRNMMAARYHAMEELKERDPELYRIRLARMPIEDAVFSLGWELTHGKGDKSEELRAKLREQVRLRVRSQLAERAHRLKQLEKRLEAEKRGLQAAEGNIDAMVESHMAQIQDDQWPRELRLSPSRRERRGDDDDDAIDVNASPAE